MIDGKPSPYPAAAPPPRPETLPPSDPEDIRWPGQEDAIAWPGRQEGWPGEGGVEDNKPFDPDAYAADIGLAPLGEKALSGAPIEKLTDRKRVSPATARGVGSVATESTAAGPPEFETTPEPEKEPTREEKLLKPLENRLKQAAARLEGRTDVSADVAGRIERRVAEIRDFIKTLPTIPRQLEQIYRTGLDHKVEAELSANRSKAKVNNENEKAEKALLSDGGQTLVDVHEGVALLQKYYKQAERTKEFGSWISVADSQSSQPNDLVSLLLSSYLSGPKKPNAFEQIAEICTQQGVQATEDAFRRLRTNRKTVVKNIKELSNPESIQELVEEVKEQILPQYIAEILAQITSYEEVGKRPDRAAETSIYSLSIGALAHAGPKAIEKVFTDKGLKAPSVDDLKTRIKHEAREGIKHTMDDNIARLQRELRESKEKSERAEFIRKNRSFPEVQAVEEEARRLKADYLRTRKPGDPQELSNRSLARKLSKRFHPDVNTDNPEAAQRQLNWIRQVYN